MNGKAIYMRKIVLVIVLLIVLPMIGLPQTSHPSVLGGDTLGALPWPAQAIAAPLTNPLSNSTNGPGLSREGYSFKLIASLGDPAPGGGTFDNDFEPTVLNNDGQIAFASDLNSVGGEGSFLASRGRITPILRTGDPAPGGGTIGAGVLGHDSLNEHGDVVAAWLRDPAPSPFGLNGAVYRYSRDTGAVTALMIPGMPAPGGATFQGAFYHASINNRGDIAFPSIISPTRGINGNPLGVGVFLADRAGHISNVASPGDMVPEGRLDDAWNPTINDRGDISFGGHVAGEECIPIGSPPPDSVVCSESAYLKRGATNQVISIAHQGAPIPPSAGGGTYHFAWGPMVNNRGDVVFIGDLSTPPDTCVSDGLFLWQGGRTSKVARPGDAMPGGGHMLNATCYTFDYSINNSGDIGFNITLDTQTGGVPDTGVYLRSGNNVHLVARTGTVIPHVGTIATVKPQWGWGGAMLNERGQVLFQAQFTDGTQRLLLATPGD